MKGQFVLMHTIYIECVRQFPYITSGHCVSRLRTGIVRARGNSQATLNFVHERLIVTSALGRSL